MAQKTTDFGNFVDQVLVNVFFQPDDELSLNTVAETFSPDFTATYVPPRKIDLGKYLNYETTASMAFPYQARPTSRLLSSLVPSLLSRSSRRKRSSLVTMRIGRREGRLRIIRSFW